MRPLRAALLITLILSTGCATIERGPMQRVFVETDPPGAVVELEGCASNSDDRQTPLTLMIPRRVTRCSVLIFRDGYEPARVMLERRRAPQVVSGGEVFSAILDESDDLEEFVGVAILGGVVYGIGKGVDAIAGSNYQLEPRHVQVALVRRDASNENPQLLQLP